MQRRAFERLSGPRQEIATVGSDAARVAAVTPASGAVVQRVKQNVQPLAGPLVQDLQAAITDCQNQLNEYQGYPEEILSDETRQWIQIEIDKLQPALNAIVQAGNYNNATAIKNTNLTQLGVKGELDTYLEAFESILPTLNGVLARWQEWKQFNAETLAELSTRKTAADLGDETSQNTTFGSFAGNVFKHVPGQLPERASTNDAIAYRSALQQDADTLNLMTQVFPGYQTGDTPGESELNPAITGATHGNPGPGLATSGIDKPVSAGGKAMNTILKGSGNMTFTRVMSGWERGKIEGEYGGRLVPKLGASKWMTIDSTANLNSAHDESHNNTVQWEVSSKFRHFLVSQGINIYNESTDSASSYREPYWVWKDNEEKNLALSPVVTAVFNSLITKAKVNGTQVYPPVGK